MNCRSLFSGKNKNISICRLLKILPRVLSDKPNTVFSIVKGGEKSIADRTKPNLFYIFIILL